MIVLVILLLVYFALPVWLQAILFIVNFFTPDPIPIIDEVLMIAGILAKLELLNDILETILCILVIAGLVALFVFVIKPHLGALLPF